MNQRVQVSSVFPKAADDLVAGAKTLAQKYFVSTEMFAEEQDKIFSQHWILAGHQSEVAKPGDFFVANVAGESLIIIRERSGNICAFYNVCRHRGARLCQDRAGQPVAGHLAAIQCPYHAWTYSLDGKLIGAPDMDDVADFNRANYSLVSADVNLWEGFVFVNLAPNPIPLAEWFAPLGRKFASWKMSELLSARRINYDVSANWKLVFENYSECYHCAGVHPELTKLSPSDSAENDLCEGPFLGGFMAINRGRSLTNSGRACALPINNADSQRVFYYSIFPNMLLSLHPDYIMLHRLAPISPNRTLIACDWFFHPNAFEKEGFHPDDAIEFWDRVNRQDWHVCELSQQGISSRAYRPGPYSTRETIPAAWDREYLRQMRA
jgi:Rieske 2Fe-2S family protein